MHRLAPPLVAALILTCCAKKEDNVASVQSGGESAAATAAASASPDQPTTVATGEPKLAETAQPDVGTAETPLGAVSLPDMAQCARRCVVDNQMRAVAPEQIEADCQKTCHGQCLGFCKDGSGDRPVGFEDSCRADCDKQRDRLQQKR